MTTMAQSTRGHWIVIVALGIAVVVLGVALLGREPTPTSPTPTSTAQTSAPATPTPPTPSPFREDPKETASRERLMTISKALDRHFQKHYEFPDRLEVLIASDELRPADLSDAWGRAVDYTRVAKSRFKLCSRGTDATSYTDDDVCIGPAGRDERPGRP